MLKTRISLWYLFSYLMFGGCGFLLFPAEALKLFLSTGEYGLPMVQLAGLLMLALAVIVFRVILLRAEALYSTTLLVRLMILVVLGFLYANSGDPLFLILVGIVGVGVLLTGSLWLSERSRAD